MRRRKSYDKSKHNRINNIDFIRLFRGQDAESWYMFSKTEKDKKFNTSLRIGVFHLFFEKKEHNKMLVQGTLILEQDWNQRDLRKLIQELDHNLVNEPEDLREDFLCDVYFAKKSLLFADSADSKNEEKDREMKG